MCGGVLVGDAASAGMRRKPCPGSWQAAKTDVCWSGLGEESLVGDGQVKSLVRTDAVVAASASVAPYQEESGGFGDNSRYMTALRCTRADMRAQPHGAMYPVLTP